MEAKQAFEKASKIRPAHAEVDNCLRHINAVSMEGKFQTSYEAPSKSYASTIAERLGALGYDVYRTSSTSQTIFISWDKLPVGVGAAKPLAAQEQA